MCCGLVERKVILHQALLSVCLVDVYSIYLSFFVSHTYVLGAQKSCFSETVLLRTHNMCCGLVGRKVILHLALLSVCLVDVYQIYFGFFKAEHHMTFWVLKRVVSVEGSFKDSQHGLWFSKTGKVIFPYTLLS